MNFLGMGPMELMLILVLALIVFGPGKLPEIAGQVGKAVRDLRRATTDLSGEFNRTLSLELEEKREAQAAATTTASPPTPLVSADDGTIAGVNTTPTQPPPTAAELGAAELPSTAPVATADQPEPELADAPLDPPSSIEAGTSAEPVPIGQTGLTPWTEPVPPTAPTASIAAPDTGRQVGTVAGLASSRAISSSPLTPASPPPTPAADSSTSVAWSPPIADTRDWHWEEPWTPDPAPTSPPVKGVVGTDVPAKDRAVVKEEVPSDRPPSA